MTENQWEQELVELVEARLSKTPHAGDLPSSTELAGLIDVADLLWEAGHGAPPLAQDPVAAMLGLVPDSARTLSAKALKQALLANKIQVSTLAEKLSARGWEVVTRDVFNWQSRDPVTVPPALIQAIAEIIGTAPEKLTVDRGESASHRALKAVTSSPQFQDLAQRWAILRGTSIDFGASALESRLAAAVFRGDAPQASQMLASLDALITALEAETQRGESDR